MKIEVTCQGCELTVTVEDARLETELRRIGWRALDRDEGAYRCLECRLEHLESSATLREELG
jgi:hypothetical protein